MLKPQQFETTKFLAIAEPSSQFPTTNGSDLPSLNSLVTGCRALSFSTFTM